MRRLALVLLLFVAACAGALAEGKSAFKKGRYPEARDIFVRMEPDYRTMDERRRAEYALYRGLSHGALGDRSAALFWLREAKAVEDTHPNTLSTDDLARLHVALESFDPARNPAP